MSNSAQRDPNEIGALWLKESKKNGKKYLSGKIDGRPVVIFKVEGKKSEKSPDYRVFLSQPREQQPQEQPRQQQDGYPF